MPISSLIVRISTTAAERIMKKFRNTREKKSSLPLALALLLPVLALVLTTGGCKQSGEAGELYVRELSGEVFDTVPVHGEFAPLRNRRTGFVYRCSECHADFSKPGRRGQSESEHVEITKRFNHGMNTGCMNCHHSENRNAYVDHDGSPISAATPARLCAKCHGPLYREWQMGTHGRQNGYWDVSKGTRTKLLCVQCHDPHDPAFKPMQPDPAPIRSRFASADTTVHSRRK